MQQAIQYSIIRLPEGLALWDVLASYYELRAEVFVRQKNWDLPVARELEFEQYDIPTVTTYVVAHQGNKAIAGARLIRCDTSLGKPETASYMIRDAYLGRINLPRTLCAEEPTTASTAWELTRLVSIADQNVATQLLKVTNSYLKRQAATTCLCLGSPAVMRLSRKLGYQPKALGPILGNQDGRFLAFECKVI